MQRIKFLVLISLLVGRLFAGEYVTEYTVNLKAGEWLELKFNREASSFVIRSNASLEEIRLEYDGMEMKVSHDPHVPLHSSQLFFPVDDGIHEIRLMNKGDQKIRVYALSVPKLKGPLQIRSFMKSDSCQMPAGIDQSIWRAGLPSPAPNPALNTVSHCIVHHSAGSNIATDYTEVVRNIYVYHTTVNGWDDIGYNYLIAQDGTLYHGRDGQGQIEDDNVRGAHYCGKNSGTMGICILGNYMTILPPQAALEKLEDLLLWKLNKESLDPLDSARHPLPGGAFLSTIAGHQDGCATDCPGTFLYALLPALIDSVAGRIADCLPYTAMNDAISSTGLVIFPNPATNRIRLDSEFSGLLKILDRNGTMVWESFFQPESNSISVSKLKPGVYFVFLQTPGAVLKQKLIIKP